MTNSLPDLLPVKLPAKPPEDDDSKQAKRSKLNVFSCFSLQELLIRLDWQRSEPQDIGPGEGYYSS